MTTQNNDEILRAIESLRTEMSDGFDGVNRRVDGLESSNNRGFQTVNAKLNNLLGDRAEWKAHANIVSLVRERLNLDDIRVLRSAIVPMDVSLQQSITEAMSQGTSARECQQLHLTDIILGGEIGGAPAYSAIEVSIALGNSDVNRALTRSQILSRVVRGQKVIPAVVYGNAPPGILQYAGLAGVSTVQHDDLRKVSQPAHSP